MEKWYSRFRRGDVWYLHFPTERGDNITDSSVQRKSRPYVIVSCEENNLNAPTFNVIPITTRNSDHLPMHVYFRYNDGSSDARNQLVLCEQITTVGVQVFNDPHSHFMYSFNVEFMNKVDESLARQLGLTPRVADMTVLERIVEELAAKQLAEIQVQKEKEVATRVEKLAASLAKKFNINLTAGDMLNNTEYRDEELRLVDKQTVTKMRDTAKERKTPEVATISTTVKPTSQEPSKSAIVSPRSKRGRWTPELKQAFLEDYKTMSVAELATKYDIKKSTVSYNVCVFRKEVEGR